MAVSLHHILFIYKQSDAVSHDSDSKIVLEVPMSCMVYCDFSLLMFHRQNGIFSTKVAQFVCLLQLIYIDPSEYSGNILAERKYLAEEP